MIQMESILVYMKKGIKGEGEWLYDSAIEKDCYPIIVRNGEKEPHYDKNGKLITDKNGNPVYFPKYDEEGKIIADDEGYPIDFPLYKLGETVSYRIYACSANRQIYPCKGNDLKMQGGRHN